ncbi:hypothetical protein [Roseateles toxinivorans]|uniref:Uncharacterized protein n=1 Tax=Roseateles toxinivorans TaxID=270368 RepID=A0A4R6QSC1_9BURK|nr:hypothetical protein [Roseateles toxinivorans]TDP74066.1 hypothetical protein DES47_101113 [Roseateles toxinivorans]
MPRKSIPAETTAIVETALPAGPQTYLLLREAHSAKLGPRSLGAILYQVLTDTARQALFLRIAGNEGGGYVSDEAVPVRSIMRCVSEHPVDQPLRATVFKPAFIGRSSNNWGFLSAILLTEGLLSRDADKPHLLVDTGRWEAWWADHLAIGGDLPEVRIGKELPQAIAEEGGSAGQVEAVEGASDGAGAVDTDEAMPASEPDKPARGRRKARVAEQE